jgi:hypothetical protein
MDGLALLEPEDVGGDPNGRHGSIPVQGSERDVERSGDIPGPGNGAQRVEEEEIYRAADDEEEEDGEGEEEDKGGEGHRHERHCNTGNEG